MADLQAVGLREEAVGAGVVEAPAVVLAAALALVDLVAGVDALRAWADR